MLNCAIDASGERLECMVKVTLEHREWVEKALVDSGAMGVGYAKRGLASIKYQGEGLKIQYLCGQSMERHAVPERSLTQLNYE